MVLPNCLVNQIKLLFSDKIFTSSSLSKAIRDNEKYLVQLRCYLNFHPEYEKLSNLIICICKDIKPRKCLICNKPIKYKTIRQHPEAKYCSLKCKQSEKALKLMVLNTKKTLKEKYNVNNIWEIPGHREKVESTCLKNFNCKSPLKNKVVQEQIKKTLIKKYGVDNPLKNKDILNKQQLTCLQKYNVKNISQNRKIADKRTKKVRLGFYSVVKNKLRKNNLELLLNKSEYKGVSHSKVKLQCLICKKIFSASIDNGHIPKCECQKIKNGISKGEKEVLEYIKSIYSGLILENTREIISPYELDIFLPELNLAIEYNGEYWHKKREKEKPGYHKLKTNLCKDQDIKLINIWDTQWNKNTKDSTKLKLKKLIIK